MNDLRKFQIKIAAFIAAILAVGTLGYYLIEDGWSLLDALYMTVITITTIGYGETHELSASGRVFTILLIVFGLGAMATATTHLARFIIEGELQGIFRRRSVQDKIRKLRNHYIICGYGRIGSAIALKLYESDIPFVIVDSEPLKAEAAERRGFLTICGKATTDENLRFAGIGHAAGIIPCIRDDSDNIYISLAARELNPSIHIIARGSDPDIEARMIRAGADTVVYPLRLGGEQIARLVAEQSGKSLRQDACGGSAPTVMGYHLRLFRHFEERGITVAESLARTGAAMAVCLHRAGGQAEEYPGPDAVVAKGDTLLILSRQGSLDAKGSPDTAAGAPAPRREQMFVWSDAYSVGVPAIDEEHRILFQYGREFETALAEGRDQAALDKFFEKLLAYTEHHFANEENLMRSAGYPDLPAHIEEHKRLTREVMELYKHKSNLFAGTVVDFMSAWLSRHISSIDRRFAGFLSGRNGG